MQVTIVGDNTNKGKQSIIFLTHFLRITDAIAILIAELVILSEMKCNEESPFYLNVSRRCFVALTDVRQAQHDMQSAHNLHF